MALEKLCNQKKFLRTIEEINKKLGNVCDRSDLCIKCKDKKSYSGIKKESHGKNTGFPRILTQRKPRKKSGNSSIKRSSEEKQALDAMSVTRKVTMQKIAPGKRRKSSFSTSCPIIQIPWISLMWNQSIPFQKSRILSPCSQFNF